MKKSIEKLFKNEIFKKSTMCLMFIFMCSFACFLNWKAVVGAEGETYDKSASIHFRDYDDTSLLPNMVTITKSGESPDYQTDYAVPIPSETTFEVALASDYSIDDPTAQHFEIVPAISGATLTEEWVEENRKCNLRVSIADNMPDHTDITVAVNVYVPDGRVNLYFLDQYGHDPLNKDIGKVTHSVSTQSATEFEVGVPCKKEQFYVVLGPKYAIDLSKKHFEYNISGSDSHLLQVTLDESWDENERKFGLQVTISGFVSEDSAVNIIMKNYDFQDMLFNFKMDSGYNYPILVGVPNDEGSIEYEELTGIATEKGKASVGENFVFYIKTKGYAHWSKSYAGSEANPTAYQEIFGLLSFNGGRIGQATSEYVQEDDLYKITLENVNPKTDPRSYPSDYTISITFNKESSDVNNINISFTGVKLPEDVNKQAGSIVSNQKIKVEQSSAEYNYPDRGTAKYTVKATIKPTKDNVNGVTKITLSETQGNFEFKNGEFKFVDSGSSFSGWLYDNKTCCFKLGEIEGAFKDLKSGDLNIECLGLQPNNKIVIVKDEGFKNTVVKDEKNNTYPRTSTGKYNVPYGSVLTITTTFEEGTTMDDPWNQFKASMGGETINTWDITKESETSCKVVFDNILAGDLEAEFIADKNSIPITFKNSEGIDYFYAHMVKDADGKNELVWGDPLEKESGNKKLLEGIIPTSLDNNYYFAVGVQSGYELSSLKIKANGKTIDELSEVSSNKLVEVTNKISEEDKRENCRFYKLEKVESSITVSGEVDKRTIKVTFDDKSHDDEKAKMIYKSENSKVTNINVTYGNSVTFTVGFDNEGKYGQSNFKVYVKNADAPDSDNDPELTKYQGEYKILDITENKKVYVKGVTVNKYVVNFVSNSKAGFVIDGNSFQGTKEATHGSSIKFRIEAKQGYKINNDTVVNYQSATGDFEIKKDKGSTDGYTLSGISENCTITIDNVGNITYKVTLKDVPGATYLNDRGSVISGGMKVKYGGNFEFSINVDDAYDDSAAGMFIILNGGKSKLHAQKLASGRYMVPNITEDVTIKVGNIRKNTYTVTLRNDEGIDYYNSGDKVITGDNKVNHGDSFSFRVSLYPAYSDSEISVMLGNDKMSADSSGYYTIPGIVEDKTVTVTGIHPNSEVGLINAINNLPSPVNDLNDVNPVIEASRWYNSLPDDKKAAVTNSDVLMNLQQQAGVLLHNIDGVSIDGADWYIKLVVVPISSDMDACTRIYKKLSSEYILSLYDIYLWDTLNDVKYTSYGDKVYTVTIPAPKLTNFRNPTGVHEDSNSGKVSFMDLNFSGDRVSFETNSFSAMGVVASHDPSGVSSLFDTAGANLPWIRDYVFGGARSGSSGNDSSGNTLINDDGSAGDDEQDVGNISDKFRSMNNRVTPQGSALRLILVLLILILLALALWFIYKKHKDRKE